MNDVQPYEIRQLNPETIVFHRGKSGVLEATIDGIWYEEVALARGFPLSEPDRFIVISVPGKEEEIGVIDDLRALPRESRQYAEQELMLRYLVPIVTRIERIKQEPGMWRWKVQTDRGQMELLLRNLHDHIQTLDGERMMVTDVDGQRCEVRIDALDTRSRAQLKKVQ
ncbi:DUF1854 domain-containing protein [Alicyclobacillus fodiniaquatilis]|uniref:DUF1854 domain-containing protein n=1 Tax=Alicyclobacillus fodiniaquatilis TaxID=1661150 RepID=A0ABW4JME8_9BACL